MNNKLIVQTFGLNVLKNAFLIWELSQSEWELRALSAFALPSRGSWAKLFCNKLHSVKVALMAACLCHQINCDYYFCLCLWSLTSGNLCRCQVPLRWDWWRSHTMSAEQRKQEEHPSYLTWQCYSNVVSLHTNLIYLHLIKQPKLATSYVLWICVSSEFHQYRHGQVMLMC